MTKNHLLPWVGSLFLLGTAFVAVLYLFSGQDDPKSVYHYVRAELQSFKLMVTERGIVRPARVVSIKSKVASNQGKLVWLFDEGRIVNRGLLVARFDSKPLMDKLDKAEQDLADAEAQLAAELKNLELLKEEGASRLEAAGRSLEIARLKADDLKNGSGKLKRRQIAQQVLQAERTRTIAGDELQDLETLLQEGHISQREYDKAANALQTAREGEQLKKAELSNFDQYEWPRVLTEAQTIVDAANDELARTRRTSALELQRQQTNVEKQRRDSKKKARLLDNARKDVASCDIYSPVDGILLYSKIPGSGGKRKIQIGDSIWMGQTFLEVPDTSGMVVEIRVREIDVAKLAVNMEAVIELDALPGYSFPGVVESIDSLAQEDEGNTSLRRFSARVRFEEFSSGVHVGMSASVNITYKELEQVLAVSPGAIEYQDGYPVVHTRRGESDHTVPVKLGESGMEWVQITEGLSRGDLVRVNAQQL